MLLSKMYVFLCWSEIQDGHLPQDMGSYKKFNKIILSEFTNLTEPNSHWIAPYKANIIFVLIENTRWPPQVDIL
jgi:hypothetical protein